MELSHISEKSVFVKLDDYKEVLDLMNAMKAKLEEAKAVVAKINKLREEEETEIELWQNSVNEIERKIDFIDKNLFEPDM